MLDYTLYGDHATNGLLLRLLPPTVRTLGSHYITDIITMCMCKRKYVSRFIALLLQCIYNDKCDKAIHSTNRMTRQWSYKPHPP